MPHLSSFENSTLLETLSVRPRTKRRYLSYLEKLYLHVGLNKQSLYDKTAQECVALICDYFTHHYLKGEQCCYGEQTLAALLDSDARYGRCGERALPRCLRALRAWRRLTPLVRR